MRPSPVVAEEVFLRMFRDLVTLGFTVEFRPVNLGLRIRIIKGKKYANEVFPVNSSALVIRSAVEYLIFMNFPDTLRLGKMKNGKRAFLS